MGRDSVTRWLKCILMILVLLLWMMSICLLYVSCWIRDNLSRIVLVTEGTSPGEFYLVTFFPVIFPVLITVSCFLLIIGCLGCCGTVTENHLLLGWFFFALLLTFCIELSAGVWELVDWNLSYSITDLEKLRANAIKYGGAPGAHEWFMQAWKEIHRKFDCCGISSHTDWYGSPHIQATCCTAESSDAGCPGKAGCGKRLMEFLTAPSPMHAIPYLTTMIGTVQVICLVITLKLWLVMCFHGKDSALESSNDKKSGSATTTPVDVGTQGKARSNMNTGAIMKCKRGCCRDFKVTRATEAKLGGEPCCPDCNLGLYNEIRVTPPERDYRHYNFFPHGLSNGCHQYRSWTRDNSPISYQQTTFSTLGVQVGRNHSAPQIAHGSNLNLGGSHSSHLNMARSASSYLPVSKRSQSNGSICSMSRNCYSTGLPRKKFAYHNPRCRRRLRKNDMRRLSPIRASGLPGVVDLSDASVLLLTENDGNERKESRCNNTEVDSSQSECDEKYFVNVTPPKYDLKWQCSVASAAKQSSVSTEGHLQTAHKAPSVSDPENRTAAAKFGYPTL